ncbi:hypothetical protein [Hymenobacter cavernae]|uniref:Uncharacterized protein n=1 Tax=Hymenobacter cavernae TaxID=2044852 RepID=A0ABQ1UG53_9BACT|nr:hypothetical protein [Hymenobacter cavernae]GGF17200.1 hypothetical protein GCM10011383_30800 [Hymenobacter cavernae]
MIKTVLLTGALFLTTANIYAQQTITPADTVNAVQRLFQKHRTGGWVWTTIGAAFAVRIASVAAASSATDGFASTTGGTIVGVGVFGGVPAGIGISKLTRFSKSKEEQVVALYNQSGILPPYVRKRLKTKHFHQQ